MSLSCMEFAGFGDSPWGGDQQTLGYEHPWLRTVWKVTSQSL